MVKVCLLPVRSFARKTDLILLHRQRMYARSILLVTTTSASLVNAVSRRPQRYSARASEFSAAVAKGERKGL